MPGDRIRAEMLSVSRPRLGRRDGVTRDVAVYCVGFAALRLWAAFGRPPVRAPDTLTYFPVDLLGHAIRLWTVPVIYSALPSDRVRLWAQIVFAIVCWSVLALAIAHAMWSPVIARIGAALVLLLGACIQVTEWDQAMLSESIAVSLTVLLIAAGLWVRLHRTTVAFVAFLVVLVLWIFTRHLHAAIYVPVGLLAIGWVLVHLRRDVRRYTAIAVVLAVVTVWSAYAGNQGHAIKLGNAYYLLIWRVLPNPGAAEFFADRGMPNVKTLQKESARYPCCAFVTVRTVYHEPAWQEWVKRHWTRSYAEWLGRRPVDTLRSPLRDVTGLLSGFPNYTSVRPVIPSPLQDVVWERGAAGGDLPLWVALTAVLWLLSVRRGSNGKSSAAAPAQLGVFASALLAVTALWYLAGWHLSIGEAPRIMIPVAVSVRVALLLLILVALDRLALQQAAKREASV